MKIWVLEIGEPLPPEKDVRFHRYGLFTQYLAANGFSPTWWTSSFSHAPKKHFAETDSDVLWNGVKVKFIRGPGYSKNISFARIQHNRHFARRFSELAPQEEKPDLIIAPIPIIEAAVEVIKFAQNRGIPVLVDVRDEWPDELKNLAPRPLQWLSRLMLMNAYQSMRWVCQRANGIMGVSERYVDFGLRFAGRGRGSGDYMFPLGYSQVLPPNEKLEAAVKWLTCQGVKPGVFTACFLGTIGKFFDFRPVVEAFVELNQEAPIQLLVGGNGSDFERVKSWAKGQPNIFLLGWLDAPKIHAVMSFSQVGLAPYKAGAAMSLPNKPFEYMAGKLAIVSSIEGELTRLLEEHHAGLNYRSFDKEKLKGHLRLLRDNPSLTKTMGEHGHSLFLDRFEASKVFEGAARHIRRVIQENSLTPSQNFAQNIPVSPKQSHKCPEH